MVRSLTCWPDLGSVYYHVALLNPNTSTIRLFFVILHGSSRALSFSQDCGMPWAASHHHGNERLGFKVSATVASSHSHPVSIIRAKSLEIISMRQWDE